MQHLLKRQQWCALTSNHRCGEGRGGSKGQGGERAAAHTGISVGTEIWVCPLPENKNKKRHGCENVSTAPNVTFHAGDIDIRSVISKLVISIVRVKCHIAYRLYNGYGLDQNRQGDTIKVQVEAVLD